MARKIFQVDENGNYIAEFPQDPVLGWEKNKRGIRRKIGHLKNFAHLNAEEEQKEVMRLWYAMERKIRNEQEKKYREQEQQKRKKQHVKIKDALVLWKQALLVTNKAHTLNEYKRSVELFIEAVGNFEMNQYEARFAIDYKRFLQDYRKQDGQPMSPSTQQKHIRHLNVFFAWSFEHELIRKLVKVKGIKTPRKDMKTLDIKDLDKAIDYVCCRAKEASAKVQQTRYKGLERAMMLARHTILRSGAIWSLKLQNIDLKARTITIEAAPEIGWTPKALKFPIKPINDELYEYLKRDLAGRDPKEIWFLDDGRGHQWRKVLGNLTREASNLFKELGYPKMKPFHEGFRSTLITYMLVSGVPVTTVQQLADHSSIQTTYGYLDTRRVQQEQAAAALSSLQNK